MPDSPVIDPEAVERLRKWGGEDLAIRMIEIFLGHTPERIQQIQEGIDKRDARGAETGAHSLKSSAGNLGAARLQSLCQAAEMLAEAKEFGAMEGIMEELEREYDAAREELKRIMEGMEG